MRTTIRPGDVASLHVGLYVGLYLYVFHCGVYI